jgi:hypothetical protein
VVTGDGAAIYDGDRIRQDMHVCTADYVQTVGRVHCGARQACLGSYFATNTELRARPSG